MKITKIFYYENFELYGTYICIGIVLYPSVHIYRKHQTYESITLAQAANAVVTKEQDKQPKK